MSEPRPDHWIETTMRFRWQLGEWTMFARREPIAVLDRHFTELGGSPDGIELPLDRFGDCVAYVVLSQPIADKLPVLSSHRGTMRFCPHQYQHSVVLIEGTFDDYLKKQFPKDRKKKFLYKVRKYCQHVGSEAPWREFKGSEEFRAFTRLADEIAQKTYQTKLLNRGLRDENLDEWARLAGQGLARGWVLYHGERPVAFIAGRARGAVFNDEYIGYDPEYSDFGPGNILQYFVLEQMFKERAYHVWDFGEGEGTHKVRFGNLHVRCADIYHFPRRPKPLAMFSSLAAVHLASRGAVLTLDKLQLKQRVKKILRGQAAPAAAPAEATGGGDSA